MADTSLPAQRSLDHLEGPCPARPDDIPGIHALANAVFRSGGSGDMAREFAVLLGPDNVENLYVFRDAGRVVSHVGVLRQTIHTCGAEIPAACIGSVCTGPDYRGLGLAGRLMDLVIQRSKQFGDVLMPISGKRRLYTSRGAESLGPQVRLRVPTAVPARNDGLLARPYEPADWPALLALEQAQPVRYVWDDLRTRRLLASIVEFGGRLIVVQRRDGSPAAAMLVCVGHPMYRAEEGCGRVVQYLGDPQAIPAILTYLGEAQGLVGLIWPVLATAQPDVVRTLLVLGSTGKAEITGWTVAILDLPGLVARIAPLAARGGVQLAAEGNRLVVWAAGRSATIGDPNQQAELLFRSPATWTSRELLDLPAELRIACSVALPIALPDYGLNYV